MTLGASLRIVAATAMVGAIAIVGGPVDAHQDIHFTECEQPPEETPMATAPSSPEVSPDPSPTPTPTPTPKPTGRTPAPQDCMPKEREIIWGTRRLKFTVDSTGLSRINEVRLFILADEKNLPDPNKGKPVKTWAYNKDEAPEEETYTVPWDSTVVTPRNGRYKIRVDALSYEQTHDPHVSSSPQIRNLRVDNAPQALPAPKVVAATFSSVSLEWQKAKEPDVLYYTVYRAVTRSRAQRPPYSAFKEVAPTTTNSYRDDEVRPGVYWYSIRVTRRSIVTPDEGISSTLSPISGPGEVKSVPEGDPEVGGGGGGGGRRPIAFSPLGNRPIPGRSGVPDAPFSWKLPYDGEAPPAGSSFGGGDEEPGPDPRGAMLPVAVGMFLVSSALAVGRMPY